MEATDSHIHEKFVNFSRSQCRELPKQYSFASKCLMFEDSLKTTKNNQTKDKSAKNIIQIKMKRKETNDVNSNNWYQDEISTNESATILNIEHKPRFKDIMAVMRKRIAKTSQKIRRNVLSSTPKKNISIKDLYPSQFNDAETRVHKIKQILNTIELKQSRSDFNVSFYTPAKNKSEIFLIDCNKLGHSFSTNHECSVYTINPKSSKPNSNSPEDEESCVKYEEIDPSPSFKVDLPHIQSSQFLDLTPRFNKFVPYKHCVSPNVEASSSKLSKTPIAKLLKTKKKSIKKRLAQALQCRGKKITTDFMIRRTKLKEMEN